MKATQLARKTLEAYFENKDFKIDEKTKKQFGKKGASFVTLTENGQLRGCVGCMQAHQPLYKNIQENAINAAFHDPRFPSLQKEELSKIHIEVSILSPLKKIEFKTPEELLKKINTKMGIYLKKGFYSATFLPQVWKQIPDKIEFLEHLSMKAELPKDSWKTADIFYYTVKIFEEKPLHNISYQN